MELSTKSSLLYEDYEPSSAKMSDSLFIVPSLTRIKLFGRVENSRIQDLARSFPNVIEIRLIYSYYEDCPSDVWSLGAFAFLEKLTLWQYTVKKPTKKCINMDSFLTGMSIGICENLRRHTQQNLKDSPFNDILRESPSILQLQNLKELIVCVYSDWCAFLDELEEPPEESPFISMVSVWYALQMMPNLEAKFVYDDVYVSRWCSNKERKAKAVATLKAAFKDVQPYVKLEPFFH